MKHISTILVLLLFCTITTHAQQHRPSQKEIAKQEQNPEGIYAWMTDEEKAIEKEKNKIRKAMCKIDDEYRAGKISKEEHKTRKKKLAATIKGPK